MAWWKYGQNGGGGGECLEVQGSEMQNSPWNSPARAFLEDRCLLVVDSGIGCLGSLYNPDNLSMAVSFPQSDSYEST